VNAFVINRLGTVHRMVGNATCPNASKAGMRKFITYKQALVYGLVACESCWPAAGLFQQWRHTGGSNGQGQHERHAEDGRPEQDR
jgi:hypothetical protein